jgi:cardiolipin synthase (CMP-forming)
MVSNTITLFRTFLTLPLLLLLAFNGDARIALALFLGAGLLDMVDGKVARARNETSAFGAMIDLLGDRLLTAATVIGLIAGGSTIALVGLVLVLRDLVVAGLNEALPGKLEIKVSLLEKAKIVAAFAGLSLLIVGHCFMQASRRAMEAGDGTVQAGWDQVALGAWSYQIGGIALVIAAVLTLATVVDYWRRGLKAFAAP